MVAQLISVADAARLWEVERAYLQSNSSMHDWVPDACSPSRRVVTTVHTRQHRQQQQNDQCVAVHGYQHNGCSSHNHQWRAGYVLADADNHDHGVAMTSWSTKTLLVPESVMHQQYTRTISPASGSATYTMDHSHPRTAALDAKHLYHQPHQQQQLQELAGSCASLCTWAGPELDCMHSPSSAYRAPKRTKLHHETFPHVAAVSAQQPQQHVGANNSACCREVQPIRSSVAAAPIPGSCTASHNMMVHHASVTFALARPTTGPGHAQPHGQATRLAAPEHRSHQSYLGKRGHGISDAVVHATWSETTPTSCSQLPVLHANTSGQLSAGSSGSFGSVIHVPSQPAAPAARPAPAMCNCNCKAAIAACQRSSCCILTHPSRSCVQAVHTPVMTSQFYQPTAPRSRPCQATWQATASAIMDMSLATSAPESAAPPAAAHSHQQHQNQQHHLPSRSRSCSRMPSPSPAPPPPSPPPTTTANWLAACAAQLGFTMPMTVYLTHHCWNKVEKASTAIVSWQSSQPGLVRSYMVVLLWTCGKLEERRKGMAGALQVASIAGLAMGDVNQIELQLMQLLDWSPYRGFADMQLW